MQLFLLLIWMLTLFFHLSTCWSQEGNACTTCTKACSSCSCAIYQWSSWLCTRNSSRWKEIGGRNCQCWHSWLPEKIPINAWYSATNKQLTYMNGIATVRNVSRIDLVEIWGDVLQDWNTTKATILATKFQSISLAIATLTNYLWLN